MAKKLTQGVKFRARNMCLVLYPNEDETHRLALKKLEKEFEIVYISHNKDLQNEDEEELKKEHVHVVLHNQNAVWNTALAKNLGITENYIRECMDLNKALKYLIHLDNPDKYQYDFEEVKGNKRLKDKLWSLILKADKSQEELSDEILDFIDNYGGVIKTIDFVRWINANGLFSVMKSGSGWYRDIIREHNEKEQRKAKNSYGEYQIFKNGVELNEEERSELFKC